MLVLRVFHWFEWNHFLSVKSWGIQDSYGSLTLELWHSKNPFWGLYIFYTRSQGVAALVSASAAETRTLSTLDGHSSTDPCALASQSKPQSRGGAHQMLHRPPKHLTPPSSPPCLPCRNQSSNVLHSRQKALQCKAKCNGQVNDNLAAAVWSTGAFRGSVISQGKVSCSSSTLRSQIVSRFSENTVELKFLS